MYLPFSLLGFAHEIATPNLITIVNSVYANSSANEVILISPDGDSSIQNLPFNQFSISNSVPIQAQVPLTDPANPGSDFLQPTPIPVPVTPDEEDSIVPSEPSPAPPESETPQEPAIAIPIQRIEVVGSTVFSDADLAPLIQPYEGRSLTLEDLRRVADSITQLYLERGYITSRAVLVDQVITEGVVQIRVIEGSLEEIEIEGNQRVNSSYIRSRVELGSSTPLNQERLENQLRLLRLDPVFENVDANLRAGSGIGQSILTVRVAEANPWIANLSIDNDSPPSVGSERTGAVLGYLNATGNGDTLIGAYYRSTTGGANIFDFNYLLPVNPMEGTVQLRFAPYNNRITDPEFEALGITGNSELYELSFRQPLIRSLREEFALSLGFTYRQDKQSFISFDFLSDTNTTSVIRFGQDYSPEFLSDTSTTSVIRFGQDYIFRDMQGAWALRSQFNIGTGLLNATTDRNPDGQFLSWLGQIQRVQILNQSNLLILQLDTQLTPDALLPSQQFLIGGGQSVRGYRQNARIGDNGFRLSVEDRITLQRDDAGEPTLQVAPFIDLGAVWNASENPNPISNQNFLASVGLGVLWEPIPDLNLRVDYAPPLVNLDDRGENAQDYGFYFRVNYEF